MSGVRSCFTVSMSYRKIGTIWIETLSLKSQIVAFVTFCGFTVLLFLQSASASAAGHALPHPQTKHSEFVCWKHNEINKNMIVKRQNIN